MDFNFYMRRDLADQADQGDGSGGFFEESDRENRPSGHQTVI